MDWAWVTDDNTLITDANDYTDRIDVGQSQLWRTSTFEDAPDGTTAKCEIARVQYTIFD